eukprot:SAG31_NODE_4597_length_3105_cov_2.095143_1_plen_172_part_10
MQQQGYYPETIDCIVQLWELESTSATLRRHRRFWDTVFVPWCVDHDEDPYVYNPVVATNFLCHVQREAAARTRARGKRENHSVFKQARASLAAMWRLIFPQKPPVSEFAHITGYAQTLRVTAPNLPKYSETISLDPFFNLLIEAARRGAQLSSMPYKTLRDWTLLLLRVRLA